MNAQTTLTAALLGTALLTAGTASAGLVGHWTFDSDFTSTTATNNGTASGATIDNTNSQIGGGSALFRGNNTDEVNMGDIDLTGGGYAITAWVNSNGAAPGNDYVAGKEDSFHLGVRTSPHRLWGSVRTDGGGFTATGNNGDSVSTSGWVHLAIVYDGSNLIRYINGVATGTDVANSGNIVSGGGSNDFDFKVGNDSQAADRTWDGNIDDVALFDEALSASEVLAIYNGGLAGQNVAQVIPEPNSFALLGLGGLCVLRRRRG